MKKHNRIISLIMAGLMLILSLSACSNGSDGTLENSDSQDTVLQETETANPMEEALNGIRNEVDWGGRDFGYLYVNHFGYAEEVEAQANMSESTGSGVINNAVWERNTLFEEYGNLNFVLIRIDTDNATNHVLREVQSNTGDFQLVAQPKGYTAAQATTGVLYNYLDLEIDYDNEWWDEGTLNFALNGSVYFMDGPFNILDDDVTYLMTFNKKLHADGGLANPYDLVRSGEWTMDKFCSTVQGLSVDNGDGKWDEEDIYGLAVGGSLDTFFYAANLKFINSGRDMDQPELAMDASGMERALNVLSMTRDIMHNNNTSYYGEEALTAFMEDRAYYLSWAALYLRTLNAQMENEYGVIPAPKYDKNQLYYTSWSHSIGSTLSMPTTVGTLDTDSFASVLELYVLLSQKYVRPAYYDTMLTTRNVRDADSAEMLKLVYSHRICDMAMYFSELGMFEIFHSSAIGVDKFASTYRRATSTFDKRISQILKKLYETS